MEVKWLRSRPGKAADSECFMYLGTSDGAALLWDVEPPGLIRAPQSAVVISSYEARRYEGGRLTGGNG